MFDNTNYSRITYSLGFFEKNCQRDKILLFSGIEGNLPSRECTCLCLTNWVFWLTPIFCYQSYHDDNVNRNAIVNRILDPSIFENKERITTDTIVPNSYQTY